MPSRIHAALAALVLLAGGWLPAALADDDSDHLVRFGPVAVEHAWARATRAKDGQVFLTIHNEGEADRLLAASTPVAASVEIHGFVMEAGRPSSRPLGPLPLPAGKEIELEPAGVFLKLVGLERPLVKGEEFELALTFEKAGTGEVHVEIEAADARQHSHAGHRH